MKKLGYIVAGLLVAGVAQAAINSNGDFSSGTVTGGDTGGNSPYYLDTATGNVLYDAGADATANQNEWLQTAVAGTPQYDADGGTDGSGGIVATIANTANKPRAMLQFANDGKATTGTVSISIDLKFNNIDTDMFATIELYGWNASDTGPKLSVGGGTANSTTYNVTVLGDSVNLLGGTKTFDASEFTADTWKTVTITSSLDLSDGYDYYTWRVGAVGGHETDGDVMSVDNITVTP
jgi:hypothetical protein